MALVVDASAILGLAFDDEAAAYAASVVDAIAADEAAVPAIFWFEIRNALLSAERRQRLTPDRTTAFLADLALLPLVVDDHPREPIVLELARRHQLTVYDAAYLELAQRKSLPLATLDLPLRAAAQGSGTRLFTPGN